MVRRDDTEKLDALLAAVTEDMLPDDLPQYFHDNHIKVERILLEMVRPDPVQPRRVLPEQLHHKFHNNRLTPTQALRELVQLAQVSARQQGRPFSNVLELLPDAESDTETPEKLSPEEDILRDLVNLAITIRDDGQVNPLTVVDISQGVTRLYRIETGERRYWAAWLLRDFISGYDSDGMIDCIVIPAERASAFRQAKENTARKGLTAIAIARQAALLLLTVHGYEIPNESVNNDFYRQALELDLRAKREYTEAILSAMGGIGRMQLSRYKALLQLSDEAWELADRYNLDEFRLRHILQLPKEAHAEMVQHIIQFNLSGRQIQEICERGEDAESASPSDTAAPHIRRFVKSMCKITDNEVDEFVRGLLLQETSISMARARVEDTIAFLVHVKNCLTEE
jgi:hypothetical protein